MKRYTKEQWRFIREKIKEGLGYDAVIKAFSEEYPNQKPPRKETISRKNSYYNEGLRDVLDNSTHFTEGWIERKERLKQNKILKDIAWLRVVNSVVKKFKPTKKTLLNNILLSNNANSKKYTNFVLFGDMQETGNKKSFDIFPKIRDIIIEKCPKKITIVDLGDQIEGILRASSLYQIPENGGIIDQTMQYIDAIKNFLKSLLDSGFIIDFLMVSSNHTQIRLQGLKANEYPNEDLAFLIYKSLKSFFQQYIEQKKINIIFNHYILYNANNLKFLFLHGQYVRMTGKAYQNYFIQEYLKHNQNYLIHGHFHNYAYTNIDKGGIISVPALQTRTAEGRRFAINHKAGFLIWKIAKGINKIDFYELNS